MKVLVTGANGFLATNIILLLLENGYKVKGMVRKRASFLLNHPDIELYCGDVSKAEDVENAMQGCQYVIHVAANTNQHHIDYSLYSIVNVEGTGNVLSAASKNSIKKFIYISTANTMGFGSLAIPGDELSAIKKPFSDSLYAKSKLEGERLVIEASKKPNGTDYMVLNPTFMLGAYDSKPSSGKIILMALKKKVLICPPGGKNFIHVKDAATGVLNALHMGQNGESYLLSHQNLTYREFFKILSLRTQSKAIIITLPGFIFLILGVVGNTLRFFGLETDLSMTNMRILCVKNYYSNKKAKENLNLSFTPIENAIDDALEWFRKAKVL